MCSQRWLRMGWGSKRGHRQSSSRGGDSPPSERKNPDPGLSSTHELIQYPRERGLRGDLAVPRPADGRVCGSEAHPLGPYHAPSSPSMYFGRSRRACPLDGSRRQFQQGKSCQKHKHLLTPLLLRWGIVGCSCHLAHQGYCNTCSMILE